MGSGYRVFTAGEVLTASNVQNYLQDQAVMVFGGTAARSSAIGTANFEEGMLTYLTDVDKLQVYTGATFADVYPAAASTQGLTLINTTSFSAVASQSINSVFVTTYDSYRVIVDCYSDTGSSNILSIRARAAGTDRTTSYDTTMKFMYASTGTTFDVGLSPADRVNLTYLPANSTDGRASVGLDIHNPFLTSRTTFIGIGTGTRAGVALGFSYTGGQIATNDSYDGFTLLPSAGTITGRVSVYGYNK
jgi:hypothetical protein